MFAQGFFNSLFWLFREHGDTDSKLFHRETIKRCAPRGLKLVAVFAIGYDMVDLEACKEFGVEVRNVRGASVEAVAEHVLGFYFGLRRRVVSECSFSPSFRLSCLFCFACGFG